MAEFITAPSLTTQEYEKILESSKWPYEQKKNRNIREGISEMNAEVAKKMRSFIRKDGDWESHNELIPGFPTRCPGCKKSVKYIELPKEEGQKEYLMCYHCGEVTHR